MSNFSKTQRLEKMAVAQATLGASHENRLDRHETAISELSNRVDRLASKIENLEARFREALKEEVKCG